MGVVRTGARRASRTRRLTVVIAAAFLASAFGFAVTATSPTPANALDAQWAVTEDWYLSLVNCTRTGGWVLSDGTCKGYGSGKYSAYVAPLKRSFGISDVSRRWAKKLAVAGACYHGDPHARLAAAGYTSWTWGENIGCRDGYATSKAAVLASHLKYQAEKSTGGGHWKNIKNAKFRYIGIGVWRYSGRTRLVTDFYSP